MMHYVRLNYISRSYIRRKIRRSLYVLSGELGVSQAYPIPSIIAYNTTRMMHLKIFVYF